MFRRIYWVTEHVYANGQSQVLGVYTSIPNLIRHGLDGNGGRLRLTLVKLDAENQPFGSWLGPDFSGMFECLNDFVRTEEMTADQCQSLMNALTKHPQAA